MLVKGGGLLQQVYVYEGLILTRLLLHMDTTASTCSFFFFLPEGILVKVRQDNLTMTSSLAQGHEGGF